MPLRQAAFTIANPLSEPRTWLQLGRTVNLPTNELMLAYCLARSCSIEQCSPVIEVPQSLMELLS